MTRHERLRQLASQRRENAVDALRCESEGDKAGADAAGVWRGRADCWWRLVQQAAAEYERVQAKD